MPYYPPQAGGTELGYAEITSTFNTASTHTTLQDVGGLTVTANVGARPIQVRFGCQQAIHTTTGRAEASIVEGSTTLQKALTDIGVASKGGPMYCAVRLAPSTGSHTYKIQFRAVAVDAQANLVAAAAAPAWIQAVEC